MKKRICLTLAAFVVAATSTFVFGEQNSPKESTIHTDQISVNVVEGANLPSSKSVVDAKFIEGAKALRMTLEGYQKFLDYQKVCQARDGKARERATARARATAREIAGYEYLTVTNFDEMRSSNGINDSVKLMIAVSDGDNLVYQFHIDETCSDLIHYSTVTRGLAMGDQIYFTRRKTASSDPTKVSSWLTPVVVKRLKGTWESYPRQDD